MTRARSTRGTAGTRMTAGSAIAVAALVLAGCGSGDSTVSGNPESPTFAPPPSAGERTSGPAPEPNGGGFPESPEPVESDAPGLSSPEVSAREQSYLDALGESDVKVDELHLELVGAGNGICRIRATGGAAEETTTLANAMAGQLVEGGYAEGDPEQVAQQIVDASVAQLCP